MGEQEERVPLTLQEAIANGFQRTDGMNSAEMDAENNGGMAPGGIAGEVQAHAAQEAAMQGGAPMEGAGQAPAPDAQAHDGQTPGQDPAQAPAGQAPAGQVAGQSLTGQPGMVQFLMQQLQAQQAQNQALMQQLNQARGMVEEQNGAAGEALASALNQPSVTVPVLDFNELQYDDDATRERKMQEWQSAMVQNITDAVARQYAGQLEPIREDLEARRRAADEEAARQHIWADSRFGDFRDRDEQIQKILAANHEFDGMPADRRYLMGGLIARGMDYKPAPGTEDLVRMVQENPEAMRMLDSARARAVADRNQTVPTIMPSSGYAQANAIPDDAPKTKEDLFRRTEAILRR